MGLWQEFERLPNQITLLRLLFLIPLYYFAIVKNEFLFLVFFLIAAATDVLDGYFARRLNLVSEFGKLFDPFADLLFYLVSLPIWLYLMYSQLWIENWILITVLILSHVVMAVIMIVRFKKFIPTHSFYTKLAFATTYIFVTYLVLVGFNKIIFYLFFIIGILTAVAIIVKCLKAKKEEDLK